MLRSRGTLLAGVLTTWVAAVSFFVLNSPRDPSLDHDEIYWLGSTYYYDLMFVERDWRSPAWNWLPARENPPVVKYVLGAGLAWQGYHVTRIDALSYFYLYWLGWEKSPQARASNPDGEKRAVVVEAAGPEFRQRVFREPRAPLTRAEVEAGRRVVLVCAAGASLLLLVLGFLANQWLAGLLASFLLLAHPAMISASSHAMSDTIALLFALAAAMACFRWYCGAQGRSFHESSSHGGPSFVAAGVDCGADGAASSIAVPSVAASAATGVLLGLACAAKMSALLIVGLASLLVLTRIFERAPAFDRRGAVSLAIGGGTILLSAFVTFVAVNPAIWHDFAGGLAATVTEHRRTEMLQTDLAHPRLVSISDKLGAVVHLGFLGWISFTVFLGVGLLPNLFRFRDAKIQFALVWWAVAFVGVVLWIPFSWDRYVLPVIPPSLWLLASSASVMATKTRKKAQKSGVKL